MTVNFEDGQLPKGWYQVLTPTGYGHICHDCLMLHPDLAEVLAVEKGKRMEKDERIG
jgi:hypothetical protein